MAAQQVRKERIVTVRVDSGRTLSLGKFDGPKVPDFGQWSHPVTVAKAKLEATQSRRVVTSASYPVVIEDASALADVKHKRLKGTYDTPLGDFAYALLAPAGDTYSLIPVSDWRTFRPDKEYRTLNSDEAEAQMEKKEGHMNKWLMAKMVKRGSGPAEEKMEGMEDQEDYDEPGFSALGTMGEGEQDERAEQRMLGAGGTGSVLNIDADLGEHGEGLDFVEDVADDEGMYGDNADQEDADHEELRAASKKPAHAVQRAEEQEGGLHLQHGDVVLRDADGKEMSAGGKELRKKLREINAVDLYDEEDDFEFDESDIEDAANEGAPDEEIVKEEPKAEEKDPEWKVKNKGKKRSRESKGESPAPKKKREGAAGEAAAITPDEIFTAVTAKDMTTADLVRHLKPGGRLSTKEQQKVFKDLINEHFTLVKKGSKKIVCPKPEKEKE